MSALQSGIKYEMTNDEEAGNQIMDSSSSSVEWGNQLCTNISSKIKVENPSNDTDQCFQTGILIKTEKFSDEQECLSCDDIQYDKMNGNQESGLCDNVFGSNMIHKSDSDAVQCGTAENSLLTIRPKVEFCGEVDIGMLPYLLQEIEKKKDTKSKSKVDKRKSEREHKKTVDGCRSGCGSTKKRTYRKNKGKSKVDKRKSEREHKNSVDGCRSGCGLTKKRTYRKTKGKGLLEKPEKKLKKFCESKNNRKSDLGLSLPESVTGLYCLECNKTIQNRDHFRRFPRCGLCTYTTFCCRAYSDHMITFHARVREKDKYICIFSKGYLECGCGVQYVSGNGMASHITRCKMGNWMCRTSKLGEIDFIRPGAFTFKDEYAMQLRSSDVQPNLSIPRHHTYPGRISLSKGHHSDKSSKKLQPARCTVIPTSPIIIADEIQSTPSDVEVDLPVNRDHTYPGRISFREGHHSDKFDQQLQPVVNSMVPFPPVTIADEVQPLPSDVRPNLLIPNDHTYPWSIFLSKFHQSDKSGQLQPVFNNVIPTPPFTMSDEIQPTLSDVKPNLLIPNYNVIPTLPVTMADEMQPTLSDVKPNLPIPNDNVIPTLPVTMAYEIKPTPSDVRPNLLVPNDHTYPESISFSRGHQSDDSAKQLHHTVITTPGVTMADEIQHTRSDVQLNLPITSNHTYPGRIPFSEGDHTV